MVEGLAKETPLLRQNKGLWQKVKVLLAELVLHFEHINSKSVFASELLTGREVVNFLVLV